MTTEFTVLNHNYRIKKMNMIEVLAIQSQISFKDVESTQKFYNEVLEHTTSSNKKTDSMFAYYFVGSQLLL